MDETEIDRFGKGWILGKTEERNILFLPKEQLYAPKNLEERHNVGLTTDNVLEMIKRGVLTPEHINFQGVEKNSPSAFI